MQGRVMQSSRVQLGSRGFPRSRAAGSIRAYAGPRFDRRTSSPLPRPPGGGGAGGADKPDAAAKAVTATAAGSVASALRPAVPADPAAGGPPPAKQQAAPSPAPQQAPPAGARARRRPTAPAVAPAVGTPRPALASGAEVVVMILGGGPGSELRPLTETRAEPAMPFAGLFRLIDIPISNCINHGLDHIYVLAQFNSTSLNRHISRAYNFLNGNPFTASHDGFVECLNATQRPGHVTVDAWYQGTADAVRHYVDYLAGAKHAEAEDVLVLSGDQIYRMDFADLINYHRARGADVTIATTPADEDHALHLGVLQVDDDLNVQHFEEKPPEATLHTMSMDTQSCFGLCTFDAEERPYVASMGIYVFKKKVLIDLLTRGFPAAVDFSRDILPALIGEHPIVAYPHTSYWEDVGSLKDYYNAHMALARGTLKLQLFSKDFPIYTEPRTLPPTKCKDSVIQDTLLGDGCRVVGSSLRGCVVGPCTFVDRGCDLQDSVIFGADEFELESDRRAELAAGEVPLGIGAGSVVKRAILDRNVRIGRNVQLVNRANVREGSRTVLPPGVVIRKGLVVVKRGVTVPDGTIV